MPRQTPHLPRIARLGAALLTGAALVAPAVVHADQPLGTWLTDGGKSRVRINACGQALCGNITWLREPTDEDGKPKTDKNNPDTGKRGRALIGTPILLGMAPDGEKRWKGSIYNPEDGKTYTAYLTTESASQLKVEGCVLGGIICRAQTWTAAR